MKLTGQVIGGGKVYTSVTKSSAAAIRPPNNPHEKNSITVSGEPPQLLYPGSPLT